MSENTVAQVRVLTEVINERKRQDHQWGGPAHDDTHNYGEWIDLISERCDYALLAKNAGQLEEYRRRLIQIAALAVAVVESFDRKRIHHDS